MLNAGKDAEILDDSDVTGENVNVQLLWETVWPFLVKLNMQFPYELAVALLGIYPREMETYVHAKLEHQRS